VRDHGEEAVARAGRQRAVHRVDDADLDAAVEGAIASKYRNTGQTCVCANRLLVHEAVYDAFAAKLAAAVKKLKPAPGSDASATQGPLIDDKAVEKVESHIADATAKGARVLVGGKRHALGGRFFEPTILVDVTPAMAVAREETFGPVAPLFRFTSDEEAIALANDTEFASPPTSTAATSAVSGASPRRSKYGIVGITPASSRPKSRRLAREGVGLGREARIRAGRVSRDQISVSWGFEDLRI